MTRHDRPEGRPAGVGTQGHDTEQGNDARGSVVRLAGDAERMAADLFEKLGPARCDALMSALAEQVGHEGPPTTRTHRLARLRYRAPWWSPSTATRVRIYARLGDAQAAAFRLRDRGYAVEICTSRRWPWRLVRQAPWSAGQVGEVVR